MLQKIINILIITASLLFTACAEDNNNDNNISHDNSSKYDFVYNEPVVVYTITGNYDTGIVEKNILIDNITVAFNNIRNEEVYILIPESDDNKDDGVCFLLLNNTKTKCSPLAECSITFNMLIKEQSQLNNNFSIYLPVTLLNK